MTPRLVFLFLDGVGLGAGDPGHNPFVAAQTPTLDGLLGGSLTAGLRERAEERLVVRKLDALLGCAGLPQSATGQATLLSGKNCAALMGRHYGPWPGPTLKAELDKGSLFSEVLTAGGSCAFVNAYPKAYFEALERGRHRVNVPVYAARRAGVEMRTAAHYARGEAIAADLTGTYQNESDPTAPVTTEVEAGRRLAALGAAYDLSFFDFWLTDAAGHRWSQQASVRLVEGLDRFLAGLVPNLGQVTLLLTSDHGNLEDKAGRTHTFNPVPLLAVGPGADAFAGCSSLLDVAPAVRQFLRLGRPRAPAG